MTIPDYVFDKYLNPEKTINVIDEYQYDEIITGEVCEDVLISEASEDCILDEKTNKTICTPIDKVYENQCTETKETIFNVTKTSEYKIPTLNEAKNHIIENKSLPRIESAENTEQINVVQKSKREGRRSKNLFSFNIPFITTNLATLSFDNLGHLVANPLNS